MAQLVEPGATFGELALFGTDKRRQISVRASTSCDLLYLKRTGMEALMERYPQYVARLSDYAASLQAAFLERNAVRRMCVCEYVYVCVCH